MRHLTGSGLRMFMRSLGLNAAAIANKAGVSRRAVEYAVRYGALLIPASHQEACELLEQDFLEVTQAAISSAFVSSPSPEVVRFDLDGLESICAPFAVEAVVAACMAQLNHSNQIYRFEYA